MKAEANLRQYTELIGPGPECFLLEATTQENPKRSTWLYEWGSELPLWKIDDAETVLEIAQQRGALIKWEPLAFPTTCIVDLGDSAFVPPTFQGEFAETGIWAILDWREE